MDPDGNRAEENPDCIPKHRDFQVSLELAMEYLLQTGRTFRAERVPLCYMRRFAHCSTETRKIVKEARSVASSSSIKKASFTNLSSSTGRAQHAMSVAGTPSVPACTRWPRHSTSGN